MSNLDQKWLEVNEGVTGVVRVVVCSVLGSVVDWGY
jgi:hypothetical protein